MLPYYLQTETAFFSFFTYLDISYFSWFIALARTSDTVLNKNGESEHPYLVPHLRGELSPVSVMLPVGLLSVAFIMLRYILSIPSSEF